MRYKDFGIEVDGQDKGEIRVICPECGPRRRPEHRFEKDLTVNLDKEVWFCQHCGWKGGLQEGRAEIVEFKPIQSIARPSQNPNSKLYNFFAQRKISKEVVDRNQIGQATVYIGAKQEKQWAIIYPMQIGSETYNEKYRTEDKQYQHPKGATLIMYKLNDVAFSNECIITEGFEDALAFEEAGFPNAISVPNGAPPPTANGKDLDLKYLDNSYSFIKHCKKFFLAVDNDPPGERLKAELSRRLGKSKCYIVKYPDGCKDANDVLVKFGAAELKKCLYSASPCPVEGVYEISVVEHEIRDIYAHGVPKGVSCGLSSTLDDKYKVFPGMMTVVTGMPNHGKSPFVDNICVNLAKLHGWKTAFFTPEHGFITYHSIRLMRQWQGEQFFPYYADRMQDKEMENMMELVRENFKYIYPKDENFALDNILEGFSYCVAKWGVKNVVIDPWNAINHEVKFSENESNYIGKMLNKIKYFARLHDVHVWVIAHPTKMRKQKDSKKYETPTLYDISGSANWRNVPEGGLVVWREFNEETMKDMYTRVHIQKVKWEFMGRLGHVDFSFDIPSQRFCNREIK